MAKFYKLKVVDVVRETPDCVSVSFDVPNEIKSQYNYIQGQYLTIKSNLNGEELRRSYSICSSPITEKELRVAVKKVKDGRFSTFINDRLKPGDELEVMTPMGNFHSSINAASKKNYVLFAGGSGITPMLSIIKTVLHAEPGSRVTLFYGNNDEASIIFKRQLDQLETQYQERLKIYHIILNRQGGDQKVDEVLNGIMTIEKNKVLIEKFVDLKHQNEYFICGPSIMMANVVEALNYFKVPQESIHIEYFSAPVDTSAIVENSGKEIKNNGSFESTVTIICDGDEKTMKLNAEDTILEAALKANMDAPYACQGGSCCTCRAKLLEGKVEMKTNYALSNSEVKEGYILTCQSRPLTPVVIVSYDQR
jgi:ring-1,2-phenylacetyl-CoA epoxidase subunit PaaE